MTEKEKEKTIKTAKELIVSSTSKKYAHLDKTMTSGEKTFSTIKRKTKTELAKEMEIKKEKREELTRQQESIKKYWKVIFLNLKDTLDNSIVANNYLFELVKDVIGKDERYYGLYKIDVIRKNEQGIICRIAGANYKNDFMISNEQIMQKKTKEDKLEEIFTVTKTYYTPQGEKRKETRPGRRKDFLEEIQKDDSVIIDVQWGNIKKINPDDIIEEIEKYIKENDDNYTKSKKIQTAMRFFNESKENLSLQCIKDFFNKLVRTKQRKRNQGKTADQLKETYMKHKEHFAEVLKRFLNQQQLYVHKENDIDKAAVKFLLTKKFGIDPGKVFNEIEHSEAENIKEWVLLDISGTANGLKVVENTVMEKWKKIIKRKKIASEHTDASDDALLSNRPSSTTQMVFKIFKELWAIKPEELSQIQRFVNFVNAVDSMDYQISGIDYPNNYQTILGLHRVMDIKDIFDYFNQPERTGFEKLPERYLNKTKIVSQEIYSSRHEHTKQWENIEVYDRNNRHITLQKADDYWRKVIRNESPEFNRYIREDNRVSKEDVWNFLKPTLKETSEKHKERTINNIKVFEKLKEAGKEFTYNGTKFIVDLEGKIKDGPQTTGYHKDENNNSYGYFTIRSKRGNIYMYSPKRMPAMIQWYSTESNGHFLIINNPTLEDTKELLEKFTLDVNPTIKDDIIDRLRTLQEKKNAKGITKENIQERTNKLLNPLTEKDIQIGKKHMGIIKNIQNKLAFVNLDNEGKLFGIIKVKNRKEFSSYKKWDFINVRIEDIIETDQGKKVVLSIVPTTK